VRACLGNRTSGYGSSDFNFFVILVVNGALLRHAEAKKAHDPNSLGFDDPGIQVFGSAHLFATPSKNVVCQLTDEHPQRIFCERREPEYAALYLGPTGTP
jgi:hypothetical protein